jgi:chromosome segregation protein
MEDARRLIPDLEAEIKKTGQGLESLRQRREAAAAEWKAAEGKINGLRDTIDQRRNERSEINGKCIELRLKHQNLIDRITAEYRIAPDAIQLEPEPEWPPEGKPDREALENTIAEMRARIEAIGPVYEGAIEEYEQLQERFAFLNQQQDDLVKSKHQLMEMIRKINQTTTDLFAKTFEAINNNFQTTFKQLFGGGSAKLMLADDEDILESGIEIIARPPGKRLQSVSLLSGGERTLTAVALLFAIYMVKPSPFCVLDELDAALDEPNNRRFIKMLEGFLSQSQFIIITHNQQTIAASSVIYGVTMPETGVSKIVSMKFNKNEARPTLEPAGPEPELPPMAAVKPEDQPAEPAAELAAVAESAPAEEPPPAPAGAAPATP